MSRLDDRAKILAKFRRHSPAPDFSVDEDLICSVKPHTHKHMACPYETRRGRASTKEKGNYESIVARKYFFHNLVTKYPTTQMRRAIFVEPLVGSYKPSEDCLRNPRHSAVLGFYEALSPRKGPYFTAIDIYIMSTNAREAFALGQSRQFYLFDP